MADNPGMGGGKIRPRRATSSRKPYSRPSSQQKSLFSKVSDSVKSWLNPITPRWLMNFGGQGQKRNASESDDQGVSEPSRLQNQEESVSASNNSDSARLTRPPLKNHQSTSTSSQYCSTSHTISAETRPKEVDYGKEGLLRHLNKTTKRARMDVDTPLTSDSSIMRSEMKLLSTNDNASVASSSGCSSSVQMGSHKGDFSDNESLTKNLWNASSQSKNSRQQSTMGSSKKPRFNPSIFGMPALGVTSPEPHRSSFYDGAVKFGGANASGRSPYFATPYKIPSVTKVKVRHVNHQRTPARNVAVPSRNASLPLDDNMSSSARKILQTLEKISSPLSDARRIPTMARTPSSYAADRSRRRTLASSTLLQNSASAPPITGLSTPSPAKLRRRTQVPTTSSLLVRKKEKVHFEEDSVKKNVSEDPAIVPNSRAIAARGLPAPIASMSSSAGMVTPNTRSPFSTPSSSGGGKIKPGKKSSAHYKSLPRPDEEESEQMQLPNVSLPVSSLPSFNFAAGGMTSTPACQPVKVPVRKQTPKDPKFDFASPIVKTVQSADTPTSSDTLKYQFSSPQTKCPAVTDTPKAPSTKSFGAGSKAGAPSLVFAPNPKVISAAKAAGRRSSPFASPNASSAEPKAAEPLKKGSVMDILGKGSDSERPEEKTQPPPFKAKTSGWSCEVCMIPNDESDAVCAACTTPNPNATAKPSTNSPASKDAIKKPETGFKSAMFSNEKPAISFGDPSAKITASKAAPIPGFGTVKSDAEKIPAASVKFGLPASSSAVSSETASGKSAWGNAGKKQTGTWECEVCMVPNSEDRKNCEACSSAKPGTKAEAEASFKFGEKSSGLFKFGTPKEKDAINVTKSPTSDTATQTTQSVAPSNAKEPAKPSFSFGTPTSIGKPTEAPKVPSFGTGSVTKPDGQTNLSFGLKQRENEPSQSETEDADAQKLPTFQFGAPLKVSAGSTSSKPAAPPATKAPAMFSGPPLGTSTGAAPQIAPTPVSVPPVLFGSATAGAGQATPVSSSVLGAAASAQIQPKSFASDLKQDTTSASVTKSADAKEPIKTFTFGVKSSDNLRKTSVPTTAPPAFSLGGKSTGTTAFGSGPAQDKPDTKVSTPVFSGFGQKPTENKLPSAFGSPGMAFTGFGKTSEAHDASKSEPAKPIFSGFGAGSTDGAASKPAFSGFGKTPEANAASKSEPSKPVFGGFGTGTSNSAGAGGNIFGSAPKPTTNSPFGGGASSGAPDNKPSPFGSSSGMKSAFGTGSAFGAAGQTQRAAPAFGSSAATPAFGSSAPAAGGAFGKSAAAVSNNVFGGGNAGKPAFGQSSSATMLGANNPSTGGFQFGASNTQQNAGFQFGAGSKQASNQPSTGFAFGSSNAAPAAPSGGGFAFGGNATAGQSNGVFQFGASNSQPPPGPSKMAFGSGAAPAVGSSSGFNFSGSAAPAFNFTGGQPQQQATPSLPMFGGGGPQNPFDQSRSATPPQARRIIKSARRKLRK